jgi:hypothetical protein
MDTNAQQPSLLDRAREMRAIGDQMHDQLAREEMLRLASKHERLADWLKSGIARVPAQRPLPDRPSETRLRGWAWRIRTGESVRGLPD